jgi:Cu-Zn family superoxide dismutase
MQRLLAALGTAGLLCACATPQPGPAAVAKLNPTNGNAVSGMVRFVTQGPKVVVAGEISGLKPNAEHGFHIHEKGDCSSGDGMSTGGHFNPDGHKHGAFAASDHHAGDLQSLKTDANGVAKFSFESTTLKVASGETNVVGRGLIVHREPDDFLTQPTGNSGPRLACGVIALQ